MTLNKRSQMMANEYFRGLERVFQVREQFERAWSIGRACNV